MKIAMKSDPSQSRIALGAIDLTTELPDAACPLLRHWLAFLFVATNTEVGRVG